MELEQLKEALYAKMKTSSALFAYRKKDGSLRIANGTTCEAKIPENLHPSGKISPSDASKRYYDIESGGWRSFKPENLVWVEEHGASNFITDDELATIAEKCLPN